MARSPSLRVLVLVAAVLAGALAACGDDGGSVRDGGGSSSGSGSGSGSGTGLSDRPLGAALLI